MLRKKSDNTTLDKNMVKLDSFKEEISTVQMDFLVFVGLTVG